MMLFIVNWMKIFANINSKVMFIILSYFLNSFSRVKEFTTLIVAAFLKANYLVIMEY